MIFFITYLSTIIFSQIYSFLHNYDPKLLIVLLCQPLIILFLNNKKNYKSINIRHYFPLLIFVLLLVLLFFRWYTSPFHYTANRSIAIFWSAILFFITGIKFYIDKNQIKTIYISLVYLISFSSFYVILEYLGFVPNPQIHKFPIEISGHIGHKNVFGFMAMVALLLNMHFLQEKSNQKKFKFTFIIILIGLILSDSRSSLFLSFIGLFLLSLKNNPFKNFKNRITIYTIFTLLSLVPLYLWNDNVWVRFAKLFLPVQNFSHRSAIYYAQINMFFSNPFFGQGIGSFIHNYINFVPEWFYTKSSHSIISNNGHNEYLEILSELGISGFLFYFSFWFGAVILGVKKLKKQINSIDYLNLIILVLMMIHASISVASKRLPAICTLWFFIGLFWSDYFISAWSTINKKKRNYVKLIFTLTSIIVALIFSKLLIADFYYSKSKLSNSPTTKTIRYLNKSLAIYPDHPYSLYKMSYFAMGSKDYNYVVSSTSRLNESAPSLFPNNYLKGYAFLEMGEIDSAIIYATNESRHHKKHIDTKVLFAHIYAKNGNCNKLRKLQNLIAPKSISKSTNSKQINEDELDNQKYVELTGSLRSKFGGPHLRRSWKNYKSYHSPKGKNNQKSIKSILNLKCKENIKTNLTTQ